MQSRHFFSKSGHFFPISEKRQGRRLPLPLSSYTQSWLAKLVKNIVISLSLHYILSCEWGRAFSFGSFHWRQTFCYLFSSHSCGRRFRFFIDRIGVTDRFIDGISSLLANNFCKLGIARISMIPMPQNILFWYQFTLKNVSVISFFMFFFS